MLIKVLGQGCSRCSQLEANTRQAVKELGVEAEVVHVSDYAEIAKYGALRMPALVVDEKLRVSGRTLSVAELVSLLAGVAAGNGK